MSVYDNNHIRRVVSGCCGRSDELLSCVLDRVCYARYTTINVQERVQPLASGMSITLTRPNDLKSLNVLWIPSSNKLAALRCAAASFTSILVLIQFPMHAAVESVWQHSPVAAALRD